MSFQIRKNVPLPEMARGTNNEIAAALRQMEVGDSIHVPLPSDKEPDDFRRGILNGVKALFRKKNEEIGFSLRDEKDEDGNEGVGVWRTEYAPPAPRKEKTPQQKAADKKKREDRKKAKEAEAAKAAAQKQAA